MTGRSLKAGAALVLIVVALLTVALFTKTLPRDGDGYHWEYASGSIIKIKTFTPPPGTHLISEVIDGKTLNYYGTTAEQQP